MKIRMSAVALLVCIGAAHAGGERQTASRIEPKADQQLKAMANFLSELKTFTFQVEEFFDVVQDDGQKLQLSNQRKLSVSRPNKVFGEAEGDTASSRFFYDGKTVTVADRQHKTYAIEKVSGTIDAMLDELHERFGIDQPLADFLFSDPYKVFTENVQSGAYIGLHHVGKVKCHHLAFRQKRLDWQIWIDAGDKPLPRKLLITFKRQAGEPQFTALLHRWDVNPVLAPDSFQFTPPADMRKVEFLKRHGEPEKKPTGR